MAFPVLTTGITNSVVFGCYSNALGYLTKSQRSRGKPASAAQVFTAGCFSGLVQVRSPDVLWLHMSLPCNCVCTKLHLLELQETTHVAKITAHTNILAASHEIQTYLQKNLNQVRLKYFISHYCISVTALGQTLALTSTYHQLGSIFLC